MNEYSDAKSFAALVTLENRMIEDLQFMHNPEAYTLIQKFRKEGKEMNQIIEEHFKTLIENEKEIERLKTEIFKRDEALERIKALTYSWTIAELTINCNHTYVKIREICKRFIGGI